MIRIGKAKVVTKNGRQRVQTAQGYATKRQHLKAARLEKAWRPKTASGVRVTPRGDT